MNTHIWMEDERTEAPCPQCRDWVDATYKYRTLPREAAGVKVDNVLVAVCDKCDTIVGIPDQSAPKIKEAREKPKSERVPVRFPRELDDIMYMVADRFDVAPGEFSTFLIRYYLHALEDHPELQERVAKLAKGRLAAKARRKGTRGTHTFRVQKRRLERIDKIMQQFGIQRRSDILRGIVVAAKEDVLDHPNSRQSRELRRIAEVV